VVHLIKPLKDIYIKKKNLKFSETLWKCNCICRFIFRFMSVRYLNRTGLMCTQCMNIKSEIKAKDDRKVFRERERDSQTERWWEMIQWHHSSMTETKTCFFCGLFQ